MGQSKCPNCDGTLEYRADHRKFGCRSCGSFFTDEQVKKLFKGKGSSPAEKPAGDDDEFCQGELYKCTVCGAEIMAEADLKIGWCFCCGGGLQKKGSLPAGYRPEGILPFEIGSDKAVEIFRENLAYGRLSPSFFSSDEVLSGLKGVYLPVWMADCNVGINVIGTGKIIKSWIYGRDLYTETRDYSIERHGGAEYFSVPSDAVGKLDKELLDMAGNYDFTKLQRFDPSDIYRYPAEYCSVNKGEAFRCIKEKVIADAKKTVRKSVSKYNEFIPQNEDIDILGASWNYVLVPMWLLTYTSGRKTYRFAVNGQTGKFAGRMPVSSLKISLWALLVFVTVVLLTCVLTTVTGFTGSGGQGSVLAKSIGIGSLLGAAAAFLVCSAAVRSCRKTYETEPDTFAGDAETDFTTRRDLYVRQYTTKVLADK
ncbi:hypothetical protein [Ruminococcus sp. HUN007]|uniref:hypothetical protein n=1 Tax=Ruminococcus sp. HUN007 TaxID=1514668 RepID=UPI0005D253B2|nr:hypothetical protein [Ruminococcus sp. HUN007]